MGILSLQLRTPERAYCTALMTDKYSCTLPDRETVAQTKAAEQQILSVQQAKLRMREYNFHD
jgi:hypothetical protein